MSDIPPPPPDADDALPPPPQEEDAAQWDHTPPPLENLNLSDEELNKANLIDAQIRIGQVVVADCVPIGTRYFCCLWLGSSVALGMFFKW